VCGAAARGFTHLSLFIRRGVGPRRGALAARVEPYHFNIGLAEPADVGERGMYVDHLYF
jgi:hypothetical protein